MDQFIYNTQSRKKEKFIPIESGKVKMYVCGPTVYDFLHVGNFRGAIFFNLVANWFRECQLDVTYVYNYTDIDDKIIDRANKENVKPSEIAKQYIEEFEKDFQQLGLSSHEHNPRATEYIDAIKDIVNQLLKNKKAYIINGEIFYAVKKFKDYGKLSGKKIDELMSGARVEVDSKKENPLDFVLWKPAKEGEVYWDSEWGKGRPGWHIECSAMSLSILGDSIDIHGGGKDLIFPHHENEIAQSEGVTTKPFVKYWMHHEFLNMGLEKMSKSLGNLQTARSFLEYYHPEVMKALFLSVHYRSELDFSNITIHQSIARLARLYSAFALAKNIAQKGVPDSDFKNSITHAEKQVKDSLCDDFNTPEVFARFFELVRLFNTKYKKGQTPSKAMAANADLLVSFFKKYGSLMSLFQETPEHFLKTLDDMLLRHKNLKREDIDKLVFERGEARKNKDFKRADELRDQLDTMDIELHDFPQGTEWEVKK